MSCCGENVRPPHTLKFVLGSAPLEKVQKFLKTRLIQIHGERWGIFAIEVHHVLAEETCRGARECERGTIRPLRGVPGSACMAVANEKVTEFREFQGDEQTEDRCWS
jgi:hypothetical protein